MTDPLPASPCSSESASAAPADAPAKRRPIWAVPPEESSGGVHEVPVDPERPMEWWRPGWSEVREHVGWRWVLLLPLALTLGLVFLVLIRPRYLTFMPAAFKFALFSVALAITLAAYLFRRAAQVRLEPFCIHCGYNLTGLPDDYRCPDCGRPYKWRVIADYRRDPQWFVERWYALHKLPKPTHPFTARRTRSKRRKDGT